MDVIYYILVARPKPLGTLKGGQEGGGQTFTLNRGKGYFSRAELPRRVEVPSFKIVINPFRKNHIGTAVSKILQYRHTHTHIQTFCYFFIHYWLRL